MNNNPKVSVVMSVYNGERYLREAIESILNQTFKDFEFIIVDDGSTDRTPKILKEYAKKDKRIRIITNNENIGLTKSLNKAIKIAKGEYIARMDADDISLPERLERQVKFLDTNPEVGLLGTFYLEINSKGEKIGKKEFPVKDQELKRALINYNPFFHASVMIRKAILDKLNGYNPKFEKAQDYELWFRISKISKLANLPEFLMKRRYSAENISVLQERQQLKFALLARKDAILKHNLYSLWKLTCLIKPFILFILPFRIRYLLRKIFKKDRIYGR